MSNNKIVVVGSGIAGITAAYFEAKKGNTVTLIDSDERAGGLLKSDLLDGVYFDYGTHIMSETGIEDLDNFLFSKLNNDNCLIERQISAANYFNSTMNCKNGYVNSQAIGENLYKKGCSELLEKNKTPKGKNLEEVLLQKIENLSKFRGGLVGIKHAEAFCIERLIK
jgi:UDP-galactopyranose mutase